MEKGSTAGNGKGLQQNGHPKLDARPAASDSAEQYNWTKAWYPVAIESNLSTDRPTGVRLLGNAIVLWKDEEQKWRAFQDLCPHRFVLLNYLPAAEPLAVNKWKRLENYQYS